MFAIFFSPRMLCYLYGRSKDKFKSQSECCRKLRRAVHSSSTMMQHGLTCNFAQFLYGFLSGLCWQLMSVTYLGHIYSLDNNRVCMHLDQQQNVCGFWLNFRELHSWSFVNFYEQQETEGAYYLIDFAIRPTSIILTK